MTNKLIAQYPLAEKFIRRMTNVQPSYGAHRHQEQFIERLHNMQAMHPCPADHEHTSMCYPREVIDQVAVAQMASRR